MIFNLFRSIQTYECKVMSTHLLIKARAPRELLAEAAQIVHDLEEKLSAYRNTSELSKINQHAGVYPVECSSDTREVLEIALEIAKASEGRFDPTIGVLSQGGYGFGTGREKLLSKSESKRLQALVNYRDVEIEGDRVFLKRVGMALDLGGIGKGFAVDKVIAFLKKKKVKAALVSIGGEIHAYGKVWHLGIQHPRENRLLAQVITYRKDTLMTSSGDYERYIKDTSHHHILQPSDAMSANRFSSLTLVSNTLDAARMDALNTALFQMDEGSWKSLAALYGIETLSVDKALQIRPSSGLYQKVASIGLL